MYIPCGSVILPQSEIPLIDTIHLALCKVSLIPSLPSIWIPVPVSCLNTYSCNAYKDTTRRTYTSSHDIAHRPVQHAAASAWTGLHHRQQRDTKATKKADAASSLFRSYPGCNRDKGQYAVHRQLEQKSAAVKKCRNERVGISELACPPPT